MQRRMRLGDLVAARAAWPRHPSWCAIFLKAFARVSADQPLLRRSFLPFPWPHLYEHPDTLASVSVERSFEGESGVFIAQLRSPERMRLVEVDAVLRYLKTAPIEKVRRYQLALRVSALPLPVRRLLWWGGLNLSGKYRAGLFGTFAVSVVASFGAAGLHLLSPLTTILNYSPFESDGSIDVRLTYDHRVLDGAAVARALVALEDALRGELLAELRAGAPDLAWPPLGVE